LFIAVGSEFLGPQDRDHEVKEEAEGDQPYEVCFHGRSLEGRLQRTFSQKRAYAAQTAKNATDIVMKAVSFT
jgi:hypothetical protein